MTSKMNTWNVPTHEDNSTTTWSNTPPEPDQFRGLPSNSELAPVVTT
jgi:hypothetical protein